VGRIEELQARIEREPRSRLFAQLAEELRKAGQLEEAVRVCRQGLTHHPSYALARITLARALLDNGNARGARQELERVLSATPENILAGRLLGECLEGLGQHAAARVQYEKTLAVAPGDPQLTERLRALEGASAQAPDPVAPGEQSSPFTIPFRERQPDVETAPLSPRELRAGIATRSAGAAPPGADPPRTPGADAARAGEPAAPGRAPGALVGTPDPEHPRPEPAPRAEPLAPPAPDPAPAEAYSHTLPVGTPRPELESLSQETSARPYRAEALRQAAARVEADATGEGEIVSATLAELYLRQGFPDKAVEVYRQLAAKDPGNPEVRRRLDELAGPRPALARANDGPVDPPLDAVDRLESFLAAVRRNRR
jgi:tetratricopeptide (TPR) repeat protein